MSCKSLKMSELRDWIESQARNRDKVFFLKSQEKVLFFGAKNPALLGRGGTTLLNFNDAEFVIKSIDFQLFWSFSALLAE